MTDQGLKGAGTSGEVPTASTAPSRRLGSRDEGKIDTIVDHRPRLGHYRSLSQVSTAPRSSSNQARSIAFFPVTIAAIDAVDVFTCSTGLTCVEGVVVSGLSRPEEI